MSKISLKKRMFGEERKKGRLDEYPGEEDKGQGG